ALVDGTTKNSMLTRRTGLSVTIDSEPFSSNITLDVMVVGGVPNPNCYNLLSQTITVTVLDPPTTANAGPDQEVCGPDFTLAANNSSVGTGEWTVVGSDP